MTFGLVLSLSVHAQSMADLLAAQGQNATGTKPCRPPGVNLPPGVSLPRSVRPLNATRVSQGAKLAQVVLVRLVNPGL